MPTQIATHRQDERDRHDQPAVRRRGDPRHPPHRLDQVALVRRLLRLRRCIRLSSVGTRTSEITKSTMIADRRADAEGADGDDVAGGERQHAERGRAAGAEERRRQVRDGRLERASRPLVPPLLVPVLHDVHVVGDGEHDDERHEHAGEHVVAEAHQRVQAERPQHADADRDDASAAVFRHERNDRIDGAISVISRIGGVNLRWLASVIRL